MKLIRETALHGRFVVNCPGCKDSHFIETNPNASQTWGFNGNHESPSFTPSLLVQYPNYGEIGFTKRCHSYVTNGQWQFLHDCTHELAGKTVPMVDVDFEFV